MELKPILLKNYIHHRSFKGLHLIEVFLALLTATYYEIYFCSRTTVRHLKASNNQQQLLVQVIENKKLMITCHLPNYNSMARRNMSKAAITLIHNDSQSSLIKKYLV